MLGLGTKKRSITVGQTSFSGIKRTLSAGNSHEVSSKISSGLTLTNVDWQLHGHPLHLLIWKTVNKDEMIEFYGNVVRVRSLWHVQILMYRWFAEAQWLWADSKAHLCVCGKPMSSTAQSSNTSGTGYTDSSLIVGFINVLVLSGNWQQ